MAIKWDNDSFIHAFFNGELRRKREYGNLYVVNGEHCQLLMYKTPRTPETLIGIKFPGTVSLTQANGVLSQFMNMRDLSVRANGLDINMEEFVKGYDATKMKLIDSKFINPSSGINALMIASALIEVEGTRWLVDYNLSAEKGLTIKKFKEGHVTDNQIKPGPEQKYSHKILYKVSSHVNTVVEARESLIPADVEEAFFYDNMWFVPTEDGFDPSEVNEEDLAILRNPPSRFQFDLGPEFDNIRRIVESLNSTIMNKILENLSEDVCSRLEKYIKAYVIYEKTKEKYSTVVNNELLKELRVTTGKKAKAGIFKNEYEEIFLRGDLYSMKNTVSYQNYGLMRADCLPHGDKFGIKIVSLEGWHKLMPLEII